MKRIFALMSLVLVLFLWLSAPAEATCGAAQCFVVTQTGEEIVSEGSIFVDLSLRFIPQDRKLEGTDTVSEVLVPEIDFEDGEIKIDDHREERTQNTLAQLDVGYGLSSRWTFFFSLPFLNERDHEHFIEVGTPDEEFVLDDGSSGFGDVQVGVRTAFLQRLQDLLVGSLALKAPTGEYKLFNSEGEINEPSIQPGTGSWDLIASAYYTHAWRPNRVGYFVAGSFRKNTENDLDYQFGDQTRGDFGVYVRSGRRVLWTAQINARHVSRDEFLDVRVPSTGSTFINFTPGVRLESDSRGSLYFLVPIPVYQDVNEQQLAPKTGIMIGLSKSF